MVKEVAEEYDAPWDKKRRMAKARAKVFDEITQETLHEFYTLKDNIQFLEEQVKMLSPIFFKTDSIHHTPLPEAIKVLPDDPALLKSLLSKIYQECQQAKEAAKKFEHHTNQYMKLYETVNNYNDELTRKLKITDNTIDEN